MVFEGEQLIWTRSRDDWQTDAHLLAHVPNERLVRLPCIRREPLAAPIIHDVRSDVCVFTSRMSVTLALAAPELRPHVLAARSYCLSAAERDLMAAQGGRAEYPEGVRTAEELGRWLVAHLPPGSSVLLPGPKERAWDLPAFLRQFGFQSTVVDLYETVSELRLADGELPTVTQIQEMQKNLHGTVCFASPSAVRGFVATLQPQRNRLGLELQALALGPTTLAVCREYFVRASLSRDMLRG